MHLASIPKAPIRRRRPHRRSFRCHAIGAKLAVRSRHILSRRFRASPHRPLLFHPIPSHSNPSLSSSPSLIPMSTQVVVVDQSTLLLAKHDTRMLEHTLHREALRRHIRDFALNALRAHDCRCENNSEVETCHLETPMLATCTQTTTNLSHQQHSTHQIPSHQVKHAQTHQILPLHLHHPPQMIHQERQSLPMTCLLYTSPSPRD